MAENADKDFFQQLTGECLDFLDWVGERFADPQAREPQHHGARVRAGLAEPAAGACLGVSPGLRPLGFRFLNRCNTPGVMPGPSQRIPLSSPGRRP